MRWLLRRCGKAATLPVMPRPIVLLLTLLALLALVTLVLKSLLEYRFADEIAASKKH